MNIIILILMALGKLSSPDQYTEAYRQSHSDDVAQATTIYNSHQYEVVLNGGVVIDPEVNP